MLRLGDPRGGWDCISGLKGRQGVGGSAEGTGAGLLTPPGWASPPKGLLTQKPELLKPILWPQLLLCVFPVKVSVSPPRALSSLPQAPEKMG